MVALTIPGSAKVDTSREAPSETLATRRDIGDNVERLRVAIVHDWLYTVGGAERVLSAMLRCFPGATVYSLFDVLTEHERDAIGHRVTQTSFLQSMPGIARWHRLYFPLMPIAVEQFDLSEYDLVISSSHAVAKGVLTGPDQLHLSYVHSPMRYAWDLQHQYLREAGLEKGVRSWITRLFLHRLRMWDSRTAFGVDGWIANSHFVARRIQKVYGRKAVVIPPPVRVPSVPPPAQERRHFLTASRLVAYKNVRSMVQAFAALPNEKLVVVGDGPEGGELRQLASSNIEFRGRVPDAELRKLMRDARAFIFAAEEDFGIAPLEAQGEGTPVIALGRGGVRETIITTGPAPTGLFFSRPDPAEIAAAITKFLRAPESYSALQCWRNALRFSEERFISAFADHARGEMTSFRERIHLHRLLSHEAGALSGCWERI